MNSQTAGHISHSMKRNAPGYAIPSTNPYRYITYDAHSGDKVCYINTTPTALVLGLVADCFSVRLCLVSIFVFGCMEP